MANMLQSAQTQATTAPSFYTDYLSGIASKASGMLPGGACAPQFVGAQPLQEKAFQAACTTAGTYQPFVQAGQQYLGQAAGTDIAGAAQPYLAAGTKTSPISAMKPYAKEATCFTGYEAGRAPIVQARGLSGLAAASPFLCRAGVTGGACASAEYINKATGYNAAKAAQNYLQQAAIKGGLCAAQPYLQKGTTTNLLEAAQPYLTCAKRCTATLAQRMMDPYLKTAVQGLSDIAQRNIQQNLSPMATAASVGSGQFGSQRGAQVLGQIRAQAEQCLSNQIAQMMSQGYGQALTAAGQRQALMGQLGQTAGSLASQQAQQSLTAGQIAGGLSQQQQALLGQLGQTAGGLTAQQAQNMIQAGNVQGTLTQQQQNLLGMLGQTAGTLTNQQAQNLISAGTNLGQLQQGANQISANLGSTAASAQQAQNTAQLQAAQIAQSAAAQKAQALQQAGLGMGTLGQTGQNINLADINALATLGGQQQTIGQNRQLFPLTNLSNLASILQGYSIPTATRTTLCMSPLSAAAAIGAGTLGVLQPRYDTSGKPIACSSVLSQAITGIKNLLPASTPTSEPVGSATTESVYDPTFGGLFPGNSNFDCGSNYYSYADGGVVKAKSGGAIGCASTRKRGGLPS